MKRGNAKSSSYIYTPMSILNQKQVFSSGHYFVPDDNLMILVLIMLMVEIIIDCFRLIYSIYPGTHKCQS